MKRMELVVLTVYIYFISAMNVLAAEPDYVNDTPLESILSQGTIHQGGILRSVISLLIVIGMIYLTAWLYKKLNKFNSQKFTKDVVQSKINKFSIVSSQTMGANKNLYVVEINGKYLVLGVTQSNINLLKEFDKAEVEKSFSELDISNKTEEKPSSWIDNIENKYSEFEDK